MSSNLSKLKFMAKARELQAAKQPQAEEPSRVGGVSVLDDARWVLVPEISESAVPRKDAVDPISRKSVVFRRSFGGFNPVLDQRGGKISI